MSTPHDTGGLAIKRTHTYIAASRWVTGDPLAEVDDDGQVTTRPTGDSGDLYVSISIENWRAWNAVVEAAIGKHRDEKIRANTAGIDSAVLDNYLAAEGLA